MVRTWPPLFVCAFACSRSTTQPDAAAVASASAAADAGASSWRTDVDLIKQTGAKITVSSMVDNNHELPEHIADHDPSTAWNSDSGDLVGGWIDVELGSDTYAHYVMLVVGFDKKTETEDLFTANHRIMRVRVECVRDEKGFPTAMLREVDLDPEVRTPQRIAVDAWCTNVKLVVTAVKPGTHEGWRELAVSELGVYGWERNIARTNSYVSPPRFVVGTNHTSYKHVWLAGGATYAEACAKAVADEDEPAESACGGQISSQPGRGAMLEVAHIAYRSWSFTGEVLGFKTAAGAFVTYAHVSGHDTLWETDYRVKSQSWRGDTLVIDMASGERISCHPAHEPWCTRIDSP